MNTLCGAVLWLAGLAAFLLLDMSMTESALTGITMGFGALLVLFDL